MKKILAFFILFTVVSIFASCSTGGSPINTNPDGDAPWDSPTNVGRQ